MADSVPTRENEGTHSGGNEESGIIFTAKAGSKKQQKRRTSVRIRSAKPRSPVVFKDGKKRSRNSNLVPMSPIPEKRVARKKIHFGTPPSNSVEKITGEEATENNPQKMLEQLTKKDGRKKVTEQPPEPSSPVKSTADVVSNEGGEDSMLQTSCKGSLGLLEYNLDLVSQSSQHTFLGKGTSHAFGKYGGDNMELANMSNNPNAEISWSSNDQIAAHSPANEMTLDLIAAQPLQQASPNFEWKGNWADKVNNLIIERQMGDTGGGNQLEEGDQGMQQVWEKGGNVENNPLLADEHFPPLNVGRTKQLMRNFEIPKAVVQNSVDVGDSSLRQSWGGEDVNASKEVNLHNHREKGASTKPHKNGASSSGPKPSMASILRRGEATPKPNEPVTFQPAEMKKIGHVSCIDGRPSIYFSGEDTHYLAEKMGNTVVGKFSHSIPSSFQIQKTLDNMKFVGGFNWKHINAKHVAIQVEDPSDYAKLLVGQNGMPVWFVDRHPMRVFRWSPDFNPYFETPIAAVWCNLVGLPIHLFEKSALFAIGGMLGTPIQIDHATATQSRLSFARMCVEIDISKPPTEEFVIDMMGREVIQKVKWDKIPGYCRECRHVGHVSSACYANGQREKPMRRDFHKPSFHNPPRRQFHEVQQPGAEANVRKMNVQYQKENDETIQQVAPENFAESEKHSAEKGGTVGQPITRNKGEESWEMDEEGFQKQGRRRGPRNQQPKFYRKNEFPRPSSTGDLRQKKGEGKFKGNEAGMAQLSTSDHYNHIQNTEAFPGRMVEGRKTFSKPSYYIQLENGDFEVDDMEDGYGLEEEPPNLRLEEASKSKPPEDDVNMVINEVSGQIEGGDFPPQRQ